MNVRTIVKEYLEKNGYDGLYSGHGCGCKNVDLMPCDCVYDVCEAGCLCACDPETCVTDGDCDWHIEAAKGNEL